MKYIGPFFRMNSISQEDIKGQLFHLSKEAIKTLTLNSKCGIVSYFRSSKKSHSNNDISILSNFSPLLCIYKKSSPSFIHSKISSGFDESTFRKTITPSTNALMTLSLLELSNYYSNYSRLSRDTKSLEKPYYLMAKKQLEFYSNNLRNSDGVFIEKKNIADSTSKGYKLIDTDKGFKFSDQAFMMCAYYIYSIYYNEDTVSAEYKEFSYQILDMLYNFKEELYNISFDDCCLVLMALNIFYDYEKNDKCKSLIIDLSDFLSNKFEEKNYLASSLDYSCLFAINLYIAFEHTDILSFKEKSIEIFEKLESLYDTNKNIFIKLSDKKEVKYTSLEICFYFLAMIFYSSEKDDSLSNRNMLSNMYKRLLVDSGIVCSWPEAPTLDEIERYKKLSLRSDDMLSESYFRMPNSPTPNNNGLAPIFIKNITYSRKKDNFSVSKTSFDSNRNMIIYYSFIHYLRDSIMDTMKFNEQLSNDSNTITNEDIDNDDSSNKEVSNISLDNNETNEPS